MAALTPMQRLFAKEYLIDLNATKAAIRAGYSEKTAYSQGQRLLKDVEIQALVQTAMNKRSSKTDITAERVLKELGKIAFADIKDFIEFEEPVESETESEVDGKRVKTIISRQGITIKPSQDIDGTILSEVSEGKDGLKIKLHDKMKALELIGKHLVLFTDKQELTGPGGGPIEYKITLPDDLKPV
jgi:phage terminase small subunit